MFGISVARCPNCPLKFCQRLSVPCRVACRCWLQRTPSLVGEGELAALLLEYAQLDVADKCHGSCRGAPQDQQVWTQSGRPVSIALHTVRAAWLDTCRPGCPWCIHAALCSQAAAHAAEADAAPFQVMLLLPACSQKARWRGHMLPVLHVTLWPRRCLTAVCATKVEGALLSRCRDAMAALTAHAAHAAHAARKRVAKE
jgi:hypothetical protein